MLALIVNLQASTNPQDGSQAGSVGRDTEFTDGTSVKSIPNATNDVAKDMSVKSIPNATYDIVQRAPL